MELSQIRAAIAAKSYQWEPRETHLRATYDESGTAAFLGVTVDTVVVKAQMTLAKANPASKYAALPPPPQRTDWRSNGERNHVTPVRNQGNCGSCVAFATVAAIESRLAIQQADHDPKLDLSEAHLYFCAGRLCDQGWWPEAALDHARTHGIGSERHFRYKDHDQPCPKPQPAPLAVVTGWDTAQQTMHRKKAIAYNGPVIAVMDVYDDFLNYGAGIYQTVSEEFIGRHAVAVVGFDDDDKCWIIKNSWGPNWGESGFGRIHYGECGIDKGYLFWDPYVSLQNPALAHALPDPVDPA